MKATEANAALNGVSGRLAAYQCAGELSALRLMIFSESLGSGPCGSTAAYCLVRSWKAGFPMHALWDSAACPGQTQTASAEGRTGRVLQGLLPNDC